MLEAFGALDSLTGGSEGDTSQSTGSKTFIKAAPVPDWAWAGGLVVAGLVVLAGIFRR